MMGRLTNKMTIIIDSVYGTVLDGFSDESWKRMKDDDTPIT